MRRHSIGQWLCATSKCRPRLSKVRCCTLSPMRTERTRRQVKYSPLLRVRVRRMNMASR